MDPEARVRRLDPGKLAPKLDPLTPAQEAQVAPFLETARAVLRELDCVPLIRQFDPVTMPALYVMSQKARTQGTVRRSIEAVDELWSDVLSAFNDVTVEHRPELVFNWRHPLIPQISAFLPLPRVVRHAVEALYGQALLAGHRPVRAVDAGGSTGRCLALLDRAFTDFPLLIREKP